MINKLHNFLKKVNTDFPVSLSDKTDLYVLSEKLYKKGTVFFHEDNNEIVAIVAGYTNNYETMIGYISVVATLREYRKKGLAKKLIEQFLLCAKEKGMKCVVLYTHRTNISALNMYKNIGFSEIESDRTDSIKLSIQL